MTPDEATSHLEIEDSVVISKHVKTAYRRLMLQWHPDRFTKRSEIEQATKKAQQLNHAYEVLSIYFESHDTFVRRPEPTTIPISAPRPQRPSRASTSRATTGRGRRFWQDVVEHGFPDDRVFEVFFFSSHLVSGGYNATDRILYQKFHQGGGHTVVYRYYDVERLTWDGLMAADTHGRFAIRHINHSFRYEACREPNKPYNPAWRLEKP